MSLPNRCVPFLGPRDGHHDGPDPRSLQGVRDCGREGEGPSLYDFRFFTFIFIICDIVSVFPEKFIMNSFPFCFRYLGTCEGAAHGRRAEPGMDHRDGAGGYAGRDSRAEGRHLFGAAQLGVRRTSRRLIMTCVTVDIFEIDPQGPAVRPSPLGLATVIINTVTVSD